MTTIYVVTEGEYSGYHIIGVFSEESIADRLAKRCGGDVEEYELDSLAQFIEMPIYQVVMMRDGTTAQVEQSRYFMVSHARLAGVGQDMERRIALYVNCFAKDEKHAVKIANEKRVQFIASGEWDAAERYNDISLWDRKGEDA